MPGAYMLTLIFEAEEGINRTERGKLLPGQLTLMLNDPVPGLFLPRFMPEEQPEEKKIKSSKEKKIVMFLVFLCKNFFIKPPGKINSVSSFPIFILPL